MSKTINRIIVVCLLINTYPNARRLWREFKQSHDRLKPRIHVTGIDPAALRDIYDSTR